MATLEVLTAIIVSSSMYNIDPLLVKSIITVESNFNEKAVGTSGEMGLMQIHPKWHKEATFSPVKNIEIGTKILAEAKKKCYNRYKDAYFICYNLGSNSKEIKYPKLFPYYKKVMHVYEKELQKNRGYTSRH